MVDFLSSWAEQIVIAIIIASIIEMILPDNKNKKYIKLVIGIYILFNIISPVVNNNEMFSLDDFDLKSYAAVDESTSGKIEVNQASMDDRLQELYIEELEKNIEATVEEQGYKVNNCKVDAVLNGEERKQGINKITLIVSKSDEVSKKEENSDIQIVDKVEINVGLNKYIKTEPNEKESTETKNSDAQNLTKTLSEYYEVDSSKINISIK